MSVPLNNATSLLQKKKHRILFYMFSCSPSSKYIEISWCILINKGQVPIEMIISLRNFLLHNSIEILSLTDSYELVYYAGFKKIIISTSGM